MRILVTGGIGFVGINLVRYLAREVEGSAIVAADVLEPDASVDAFLAPVSKQVRVARLDVTDRAAVQALLQDGGITHIVHAAAITPTRERESTRPTQIVDVNLGGAINVLEAMIQSPKVERVLLLSSSGLYGAPEGDPSAPRPEDSPLRLDNLYGITKYSAELLGARYATLSGKMVASARLAAPYGQMERPTGSRVRMGQLQRLLAALREGQVTRVAGPEAQGDWTYVFDTAEAIRALLLAGRWTHSVYNVSCGQSVSFRQVVDAFTAHGLRAEWVENPGEADIAMQSLQKRGPLDISRLQADSGFAPRYDLATGVAAYVNFR